MSTSFSTKIKILAEVSVEASWNNELVSFARYNDIGLPLAYLLNANLVEINKDKKQIAENFIEETWIELCNVFKVDPNGEYVDGEDFLDKSPLPDNDDEEEE